MSDKEYCIQTCHILMVTHVLPYPPAAGNEIRVLRMLRWFASKGYRISLVIKPMGVPEVPNESVSYLSSLVENLYLFDSRVTPEGVLPMRGPSDEVGIDAKLAGIQEMFCPAWFSSEVGRIIDELRPDVVLSEYALMGRVLVSSEYSGFLKVIDSIEVFSRLKENLARQGISQNGGLDLSADEEVFLLQRADVVLAIQQTEREALANMLQERQVLVTAMDLDIPEAVPGRTVPGRVLIVGSDNAFNVSGARHFLSEVWPRVKQGWPSATLHVVGKLSACLETEDSSVRLLGYVDSIADEYQAACVVVNPCLHGTGLKIKTIEALSWGKAHVGWPVSADGILELGQLPYVLAHDDSSFAGALLDFLGRDSLRAEHEAKARAFALEHFAPDAVYGPLAELIAAHVAKNRECGGSGLSRVSEADLVFRHASGVIRNEGAEYRVHVFMDESTCGSGLDDDPEFPWHARLEGIAGVNHTLQSLLGSATDVFLFVPGGASFSAQDIHALAVVLKQDPLFGFSIARMAAPAELSSLERMQAFLPPSERRVVEGAPVLVRASVFRDFGLLDEQALNLDSALAQLFIRANRRGVSALQVNSVVLRAGEGWTGARDLQLSRASDHAKAMAAQAVLPEIRFERLLRHCFADKPQRDLLVDIRNLAPGFNGTAHHVLALLGPLSRLAAQRGIRPYFWVLPESADFHDLRERFGDAVIHQLEPDRFFDASIRLTQPWSLTEVRDQAYVSPVNVFSVLDTIAWDCHYIRMPHLEGVWRAMAGFSDGLVYISDFSRHSFNARFPGSLGALNAVAHCSMDPEEYWSADLRATMAGCASGEDSYVLIVGNRYYHKGLAEVVPVLSAAFPGLNFKVLGECGGSFPNVEQIASGAQSEADMARLFAGCVCLVFPSFYEGFGLPIFEALAFGKPVLARHSELIDELRERIAPVSGLASFTSTSDLLRGIKDLVGDKATVVAQQPCVQPAQPYRWENSAADILDLLETLLEKEDFSRCRERLEFFYRLELFDVERTGWADATQNMVSFEVEKEE